MSARSSWLMAGAAVLLLAAAIYLSREQLLRANIALRTYRARIFTPPAESGAAESHFARFRSQAQFYWDFAGIPIARRKRLHELNPDLQSLVQQLARAQSAGQDTQYSMQIYREIRWLLNFTPDLNATRTKIAALRMSLSDPQRQRLAAEQQPDGSWTLGIDTWYLKLYYSLDNIESCVDAPQYPLRFLDRINSPELLKAELDSDLYDDFIRTGVFNREKLDETFSALARLLFKRLPTPCFASHPELHTAMRAFVTRWQNSATGCWGQWLLDRHGKIWKMDDMGMTFHVVSDLHGEVEHLDRVAERLLELVDTNFPAGIRFDGHPENHLNADAAVILRYAWPTLDASTRERARHTLSDMLTWCLNRSLQPDGSFRTSELDDTTGDAYEYGVLFLDEAGYFNRKKRFWTEQDFPDAQAVRARITGKLKATGLNDAGMKRANDILESSE